MAILSLVKKPRRLLVCGHEITVTYCRKYTKSLPPGHQGTFYSDPTPRIFIYANEHWQTYLLHELIHAVLWFSGQSQDLSKEKEEGLVLAIEHGFKTLVVI